MGADSADCKLCAIDAAGKAALNSSVVKWMLSSSSLMTSLALVSILEKKNQYLCRIWVSSVSLWTMKRSQFCFVHAVSFRPGSVCLSLLQNNICTLFSVIISRQSAS